MNLIPAQFLKGAFFSAFAALLVGIFGYLTRRFMANHLPADEYAFYYSFFSLINFLIVLIQFGGADVISFELPGMLTARKQTRARLTYSFIRKFQIILASIGFVLLCISIPFLQKYYFDFPTKLSWLLIFFLLVWGLALENTTLFALNSLKQFYIVSILRVAKTGLFFIMVCILLYYHSFTGIIIACVAVTTLCSWVGDRIITRPQNLSVKKAIPLQIPQNVLRGGLIFMALAGGQALIQDFGTLTLAFFSSTEEVVLFNIALPIAMIIHSFGFVLRVFTPMIADSFAKKEKKRINALFLLLFVLTVLTMCCALPILYYGGDALIKVLFSEKFIAAKISTLLMVEAAILSIIIKAFLNFFNSVGEKMTSIKVLIPTVIAASILFPILSHCHGATGAGIATFFTTVIWTITYLFFYIKFMRSWRIS